MMAILSYIFLIMRKLDLPCYDILKTINSRILLNSRYFFLLMVGLLILGNITFLLIALAVQPFIFIQNSVFEQIQISKKANYAIIIIKSKNQESFLGDLLEMREYMKESGDSKLDIFLFTWKSILLFNFSHLILKLKEILGLSPKSQINQ